MNTKRLLDEIISSDLKIDYSVPRQKGSLSTRMSPELYRRNRSVPGTGKSIRMYFAYSRDAAPVEVMKFIKGSDSSETTQFLRRTAIYLANRLRRTEGGFDAIMPVPSRSRVPGFLAHELAARMGSVPVLDAPSKFKSMHATSVSQRMQMAKSNFKVGDQPRMNGKILIVDEYVTTGSTMVGIAANLYEFPDVTDVVGVGLLAA